MVSINLLSLAILGFLDAVSFRIPNVILCGWLGTTLIFGLMYDPTVIRYLPSALIASLLVTGLYTPLRRIVRCSAGDFKLYGLLTVSLGNDVMLKVLLISLIFSIFSFASGIRKVPLATCTFFGYVAYLIFREKGIL